MAIKNRTCLCDGIKYSYCPDCSGADKLAPAWKSEFCSKDCMILWTTATKYNMGKLTKAEAKSIILALTLKPTEQYAKCVQRDLANIFAEEPKPKRGKRAALAVFDEALEPVAPVTEIKENLDNFVVEETIHEVVTKENE